MMEETDENTMGHTLENQQNPDNEKKRQQSDLSKSRDHFLTYSWLNIGCVCVCVCVCVCTSHCV